MLFLGLGFLIGDRGMRLVSIDLDDEVLRVVAVVALALVLFLDAINLELTELRRDWLVPVLVLGPATLLVIGLLAGLGGWRQSRCQSTSQHQKEHLVTDQTRHPS
jgi:hypothetical protein